MARRDDELAQHGEEVEADGEMEHVEVEADEAREESKRSGALRGEDPRPGAQEPGGDSDTADPDDGIDAVEDQEAG